MNEHSVCAVRWMLDPAYRHSPGRLPFLSSNTVALSERKLAQRPYKGVGTVGRAFADISRARHVGQLVLKLGEGADVADHSLFVERRDWFSSHYFTPARMHRTVGHARIGSADDRLDHGTAIICFADDSVSLMLMIDRHHPAPPLFWRQSAAGIFEHIATAVCTKTGDNDADAVTDPVSGCSRWINGRRAASVSTRDSPPTR